jgi:hypothetical protein
VMLGVSVATTGRMLCAGKLAACFHTTHAARVTWHRCCHARLAPGALCAAGASGVCCQARQDDPDTSCLCKLDAASVVRVVGPGLAECAARDHPTDPRADREPCAVSRRAGVTERYCATCKYDDRGHSTAFPLIKAVALQLRYAGVFEPTVGPATPPAEDLQP